MKIVKIVYHAIVLYMIFYHFGVETSTSLKEKQEWRNFQINTMWFDMYMPMRDRNLLPYVSLEEQYRNRGISLIDKNK